MSPHPPSRSPQVLWSRPRTAGPALAHPDWLLSQPAPEAAGGRGGEAEKLCPGWGRPEERRPLLSPARGISFRLSLASSQPAAVPGGLGPVSRVRSERWGCTHLAHAGRVAPPAAGLERGSRRAASGRLAQRVEVAVAVAVVVAEVLAVEIPAAAQTRHAPPRPIANRCPQEAALALNAARPAHVPARAQASGRLGGRETRRRSGGAGDPQLRVREPWVGDPPGNPQEQNARVRSLQGRVRRPDYCSPGAGSAPRARPATPASSRR
ncbi:hypothetical protein P7K49_012333 [Saguinus oedipus]|uniref:Uncharacterized protein n=1 Tax=Saguinus oedipus TaxID=9490 RepID=A0ABQ9VT51_SAGOE|nr:hypothetical protein P7K49_012333 [Saguinus oedipus]